ncbi:MAG: hypothetical protein K6T29_04830 [Peptococcaceae bacterium]|nr:hypothetical protein [Peptococcaceae bacterium]
MGRSKYRVGDQVAVYLPDGSLVRAKIKEIIPGGKSSCYLVQFNGTYALVAERDIIQRI